jgi:magnesium transporter
MARFLKNRSKLIGKAPGTIVFIGNKKMEHVRFRLIQYNETSFDEYESESLEEIFAKINDSYVCWLNIDGIHDSEIISRIGDYFGLSPFQLEGIANSDQRPKALEHENKLVINLKMLKFSADSRKVSSDQLTIILGQNFMVTFQENVGTVFEPIRERLRTGSGKLRISGPDYLCYRILDAVADNYLLCLGELGEFIEKNEEQILAKRNRIVVGKIYYHRTELSYIRKAIWPVKEIMTQLTRKDSDLIQQDTKVYFNALDDIILHAIESVDIYHAMISDQLNIYNTSMMNHTNDVMKILTIFTSIFIPLTFITGIYGTNFDYLPELHFRYSYLIMWLVMVVIAIVMLVYYRRKRWL